MPAYHHVTVFRDRHRYVLGPSVALTRQGDLVVAFNLGVMREVGPLSPRPFLHPPYDPEYRNVLTRSRDGGRTWDAPRVFPGYDWHGLENPGLCVLANGDLLASVYRRRFYPTEQARKVPNLLGAWGGNGPYPWVVAHDGTYVHRSRDGGLTWDESVPVDTYPYVSGYTPRGAVELPGGTIMLPLAAADPFFDAHARRQGYNGPALGNDWGPDGCIKVGKSAAFVAISRDGGHTWKETREIARHPHVNLHEPALACLAGGRLICHLRASDDGRGYLYQVTSDDGGHTWTPPSETPLWGYPAHIIQLSDGRVLSVYGHRREPFGIRACLSYDGGDSWDVEHELIIRADLPNRNLGYPTAVALEGGIVFTVYWGEDAEGVATIQGTFLKP